MLNKRINTAILLLGFVLYANLGFGQTTDGVIINYSSQTRDPSAILEAYSTDQGILVPRVTLTGTGDVTTVTEAPYPTSLMVYNTATAGSGATAVTPGYYYWGGSNWVRFMSGNSTPLTGTGSTNKVAYWANATDLAFSDKFHWDPTGRLLGVGNAAPTSRLTVGEDIAHDASFNYSTAVATIFESDNNNGGDIPNGTRDILHLVREGISSQAYGNKASFALGRYEDVSTKSRTQLDIKLTDESYSQHNAIMSLRSNGNVGIGTTSPNATIHAVNTGTGTQQDLAHLFAPNMSAGDALYLKLGKATGGTGNSADIVFNWQGADDPDNYLGFGFYNTALAMTITAAGNVGIGANHTPAQTLDVLGTGRFSDLDANANRMVYADADGDLTISSSTIDPNALVDGSGSTPYLTKWADANTLTNSVVQETSGKIGVGMSPTKPLEVAGTIRSTGIFAIELETSDGTGPRIKIGSTATPNSMIEFGAYNSQNNLDTKDRDFQLFSSTATAGVMFKAATGNVGIGNTAPDAALTVGDGTSSSAFVHVKRNNNPHINLFEGTTSVARIQGDITSGHNQFQIVKADGSNPMFVINQDDGKVGIATTDPQQMLDVRGTTQSQKLRLTAPDATATNASDNYVLQLENHGSPSGTPAGWAVNKSRYGGKYFLKNVSENTRHKLTSAELFGGNANDNATAINSSNGNGDYNSLYNGVVETAGASFHQFRAGGCSGADWGMLFAFDNQVQVDQIIMKRRTDCCSNRMDNIRIQLLDASNNVVQSIGPVSGSGDYNQSFTAVNCTQIRFYIPSCGNVGSGEGIFNFSEFELYGISAAVTLVPQTNPTFVDPVIMENIPSSLFGSTPQGLVVDSDGMVRSKAISEFGTGDNLGNHTATTNIQLNNNWLSNDGGNEGVRVDNSGNVGIGAAAPSYKLDVNGSFRTSSGNLTMFNDYIYVSPTNANTLNSGYNSNSVVDMWINYRGYNDGQTQYRNFNVGNGRGSAIAWFDGTNNRMSINNGQAAAYNLDVNGTGRFTDHLYLNSDKDLLPLAGGTSHVGSPGALFQDVFTNYVYANTRVRIGGTSPPNNLLDIYGGMSNNTGNSQSNYLVYVRNTSNGGGAIMTDVQTNGNSSRYLQCRVNGSEAGCLYGNGSTSLNLYSASDERLKTNIRNTSLGLNTVMQMRVRDYQWKSDGKTVTAGFIAQELYDVYPEAVSKGNEGELDSREGGTWMVNYAGITPLLVKAIQDQQAEIEDLRKVNLLLKGQTQTSTENYNTLKAEVETLKQAVATYGMK